MDDFSDIYQKSAQKIYHFLLGMTRNPELAEELTEETFYQAYLHLDAFEGKCAMDTWLCAIAKNLYFKERKRWKRLHTKEGTMDMTAHMAPQGAAEDAFAKWEEQQQVEQIKRLLEEMEEPYREVFMLHIYGELQFSEIAAVYDKSLSWAKMTYYRAKEKLVRRLEAEDGKR